MRTNSRSRLAVAGLFLLGCTAAVAAPATQTATFSLTDAAFGSTFTSGISVQNLAKFNMPGTLTGITIQIDSVSLHLSTEAPNTTGDVAELDFDNPVTDLSLTLAGVAVPVFAHHDVEAGQAFFIAAGGETVTMDFAMLGFPVSAHYVVSSGLATKTPGNVEFQAQSFSTNPFVGVGNVSAMSLKGTLTAGRTYFSLDDAVSNYDTLTVNGTVIYEYDDTVPTPETASIGLMGGGLVMLGFLARKRVAR